MSDKNTGHTLVESEYDRDGNLHTYSYDDSGRMMLDVVVPRSVVDYNVPAVGTTDNPETPAYTFTYYATEQ
jgi:hypothetical protein